MKHDKILREVFARAASRGFKFKLPKNLTKFFSDPKNYYHIVFSREFAQAVWGERLVCNCAPFPEEERCEYWDIQAWEYHLQKMVLYNEPYYYLIEKWNERPVTPHFPKQNKRKKE